MASKPYRHAALKWAEERFQGANPNCSTSMECEELPHSLGYLKNHHIPLAHSDK